MELLHKLESRDQVGLLVTGRGSPPRTLLVGPLGARPWISRNELVAQLEELGHEVIVNGVGGPEVLPSLEPLPSRVGIARNSLPSLVAWLLRMLWRWRRASHTRLTAARIDYVLVWDPVLAGLCRFARPAGTQVIWVASRSHAERFYERLSRAVLATTADRVVVSLPDDARWVRGRVTLNRWPRPLPSGQGPADGWVVLASAVAPTDAAIAGLKDQAAVEPAAAVVFDARMHDRVSPPLTERLRAASGATHVWWAADEEWITWLGGAPRRAFDPSQTFVVDQRHVRVLTEGGSLYSTADADTARSLGVVHPVKTRDGWTEHALRGDVVLATGEQDWSANVFGPTARTTEELVAEQGVPVAECPICGSTNHRVAGGTDGGTTVLQCLSCGLRYASHVLPTAAPDPASSAAAGAPLWLDALDQLDVPVGRMLAVRGPGGGIAIDAAERGWDVHEVAAADLDSSFGLGSFDVVVFAQSLESIPEPVRALRLVRERFVEPGGHVLLETANSRSLSRHLQRRSWTHWRAGERVTYPDPWTVRQILQRSGFQTRMLRSVSHTETSAAGVELARRLGLLSDRLARVLPPLAAVLNSAALDRPQRAAVRWVDDRGFGLNVLAVGRAI